MRLAAPMLLALGLLLCACSSQIAGNGRPVVTSASPSPSDTTFTVTGRLTLYTDFLTSTGSTGENCVGTNGFDDITNGAQIVVLNSSATVVGAGTLENASANFEKTPRQCVFDFSVPNVPDGESFYSLRIGVRGSPQYDQYKIHNTLDLTLGA